MAWKFLAPTVYLKDEKQLADELVIAGQLAS